MKKRILIISDDLTSESLRLALDQRGFVVTLTENAEDGYRQVIDGQFHLVLVNLDRAVTGAGLIKRIRANPRLSQVQLMTVAEWGTGQATIALAQGADTFEPGPVEASRLVEAIERLLQPVMAKTARVSTIGDLEESQS